MGRGRRPGRPRKQLREDTGATPERWRRGDVERLEHSIADEAGRPARPFRRMDTLARMLRRGSITPAMPQAREDFRALFAPPQPRRLRSPRLAQVPQALHELGPTPRPAAARKRV